MIDLKATTGLPLTLTHGKLVKQGNGQIHIPEPEHRTLTAIQPYLYAPKNQKGQKTVYLIYRGIYLNQHVKLWRAHNLRYDITIIYPGALGLEFPKTVGHNHILKPGTQISYPEIYEVLHGQAYFLLQRGGAETISEIYLVTGALKDKMIVPPGFGHVTINASKEPLVIANIFIDQVTSIYDYYKKHRGAAYYLLNQESPAHENALRLKNIFITKNPNYQNVEALKFAAPKTPFPEISTGPLYQNFISQPERFAFLINPEEFIRELAVENLLQNLPR